MEYEVLKKAIEKTLQVYNTEITLIPKDTCTPMFIEAHLQLPYYTGHK